ncbi:DUF3127 domain-containing protein [Riemerella anatipestifer]|uniref:DUF3127 domain-containing protein n=1 Tax=Riemerella anatipestifer TaxID=34085 RepID=UPI00208F04AF|nr:DUF3127 domain-containing protein [Riemerella anatipestifer]MCO4303920.1 DUF3127 domain-containing protein [Riemerella anatipestifer]MCO7352786.1 DUF3127 domain-containing protein [Riemerella anatipestifer]MCQ4039398.1 DUF3127 domain-containing protein [Riemerella anatipestifer]MCT6760889.1 DUF3127 domain-containing protein [Riemerella anatipestifer]MCT6764828.1 DUF3127 domain-containing protein [Riemerella anatipestifer]
MELQGTIKKIGETQTFPSGFQKRELVLLTQEQYPQPINVEFLQEKVHALEPFSEGDAVKIGINIRGREWTSPQGEVKYFNSIIGWRIEKTEGSSYQNEPTQAMNAPQATTSSSNENPFEDDDDDLPF